MDNENKQANKSNNESNYKDLAVQIADLYAKYLKNTDALANVDKAADVAMDAISADKTFNANTKKLIESILNNTSGCFTDFQLPFDASEYMSQINVPLDFDIPAITDFIIKLEPQVFDSIRELANQIFSSFDTQPIIELLGPIIEIITSERFYTIIEKTQWPLYCITNQDLLEEIYSLDPESDYDNLASKVYSILYKYFDTAWVDQIEQQWMKFDNINEGQKTLLKEALRLHRNGEYFGCVAILMCLFKGFIEHYAKTANAIANIDINSINNERHILGLKDISEKSYFTCYDYIICMSLNINADSVIFSHILKYICTIILTSDTDFHSIDHNPLRNKICHGEQTNYGTWEHSTKAILATDLLLKVRDASFSSLMNQINLETV